MKKTLLVIIIAVTAVGTAWADLPSSSDAPFIGKWVIFNQGGPEYALDYKFYDNSYDTDIIGSFGEQNCMDCDYWDLRKSEIKSQNDKSITFERKYGSGNESFTNTLTMTYDPIKKCVSVAFSYNPDTITFDDETTKYSYWYARQESDVMRSKDGTSVISHAKAGDRFELDKWMNPFLEKRIRIKLPDGSYGWIDSGLIEEGVAEPIKSSAFPLSWEYEDKYGEGTIKIKKTGGNKVTVSYVNIKYNQRPAEEIQFSGTIKGNRIVLTKSRPLHFKGEFTKMLEKKEIVLIPDTYTNGMWNTKLAFEGHEFIPTSVKRLMNQVFHQ